MNAARVPWLRRAWPGPARVRETSLACVWAPALAAAIVGGAGGCMKPAPSGTAVTAAAARPPEASCPSGPAPLPEWLVPAAPICLGAPPADGFYGLPPGPGISICPDGVRGSSRLEKLACVPIDTTVAVAGGCIGLDPWHEWRPHLAIERTGADTFVRRFEDGAVCNSGWTEHWRRAGDESLEVWREAYTTCGREGDWDGPSITLTKRGPLAARDAGELAKLAAASVYPAVVAAAVERLASLQDEPVTCALLGGLLDTSRRPPAAARILALARAPCLASAVERAAGRIELSHTAARRLAALLPAPEARVAAILRLVDGGAPGAEVAALALADALCMPPDVDASLAAALRSRIAGDRPPAVRTAAAVVLRALVDKR